MATKYQVKIIFNATEADRRKLQKLAGETQRTPSDVMRLLLRQANLTGRDDITTTLQPAKQ